MKTYKLFIKHYDFASNDYIVSVQYVKTDDIYHTIGKIYCKSIVEIKRIDYQEIKWYTYVRGDLTKSKKCL